MGQRKYLTSPLSLAVLFAVLVLKLILAMGNFMTHGDNASPLFSVAEVMAEDKKAPATREDTPTKPKDEIEATKPGPPSSTAGYKASSSLAEKEAELALKEQHIQEQEQHLLQMQKDVEKKMQELIAIQKEIQVYRNEKAETADAKIRSLAQICGSMKAKEAAKLLENMDENLVVSVISTMKANEAASVLAVMDSKRAAKISEALTKP